MSTIEGLGRVGDAWVRAGVRKRPRHDHGHPYGLLACPGCGDPIDLRDVEQFDDDPLCGALSCPGCPEAFDVRVMLHEERHGVDGEDDEL